MDEAPRTDDDATQDDDTTHEGGATQDGVAVRPVAHDALTRDHLPHPRAPFEEVIAFAYTFDGYERFGMTMCGEMANRAASQWAATGELPAWLTADLDRLRGCLYFEARRWIRLEREPDTRALIYVHRLIDAIGEAAASAHVPADARR